MADVEVENRGIKKTFLDEVEKVIEWRSIEKILNRHYKKAKNITGNSAYPPLPMFKILLLQRWYNLSDPAMEEALYDRISFLRFTGFSLSSELPDHSTICRFRNYLLEKNIYERLFYEINRQLEKKAWIVKSGVIVDATIVESSRRPRKKVEKVIQKGEGYEEGKTEERVSYSEDVDAKWVEKRNHLYYGYKLHMGVDDKNGFILGGHISTANISDTNQMEGVVDESEVKRGNVVYGDKGYDSEKNRRIIKAKGLKQRIMKKAKRNKPLSRWQKTWNKLIAKVRYIVERGFGTLKRQYGMNRFRYLGKDKGQMEFFLNAMCFNIKKAVRMAI